MRVPLYEEFIKRIRSFRKKSYKDLREMLESHDPTRLLYALWVLPYSIGTKGLKYLIRAMREQDELLRISAFKSLTQLSPDKAMNYIYDIIRIIDRCSNSDAIRLIIYASREMPKDFKITLLERIVNNKLCMDFIRDMASKELSRFKETKLVKGERILDVVKLKKSIPALRNYYLEKLFLAERLYSESLKNVLDKEISNDLIIEIMLRGRFEELKELLEVIDKMIPKSILEHQSEIITKELTELRSMLKTITGEVKKVRGLESLRSLHDLRRNLKLDDDIEDYLIIPDYWNRMIDELRRDVLRGENILVVGDFGAGKTTFLYAMLKDIIHIFDVLLAKNELKYTNITDIQAIIVRDNMSAEDLRYLSTCSSDAIIIGAVRSNIYMRHPIRSDNLKIARVEPWRDDDLLKLANKLVDKMNLILDPKTIDEIVNRSKGYPFYVYRILKEIKSEGYKNIDYIEEKGLKNYLKEILASIFFDENGEPRAGSRIAISSLIILAKRGRMSKNDFKSVLRDLINKFAARGIDSPNESLFGEINSLLFERNGDLELKFKVLRKIFKRELTLEHAILDSMIEECEALLEKIF